uniref:Uncharacterized protein n=1 Tax=Bionectria ochroleuca TaxID=29856 RepID=A0A0B7K7U4_BIOOC
MSMSTRGILSHDRPEPDASQRLPCLQAAEHQMWAQAQLSGLDGETSSRGAADMYRLVRIV